MIKYNNSNINDWNFGDDNIIKVYKHGAVVFYKFDTESQEFKVCFAVVEDITQYQETEFEDVYDKATEKWYKLNNLHQYEEYGIYGSGRNITTYDGKLTIDDGYEYEWNNSSWVNVGEVSGSSITIKSPEYVGNKSSSNGLINLGVVLKDNTKFQIKFNPTKAGGGAIFGETNAPSDTDDYRVFWYSTQLYYDYGSTRLNGYKAINTVYEYEIGNYYIKDLVTSSYVLSGATKSGTATSHTRNIVLFYTTVDISNVYYMKVYEGDTLIRDFIPWTDMNGNYGMFDKVSMEVFSPAESLSGSSNVTDVTIGEEVYPKYYEEKSVPLDNLTFNTLAEAQAYAKANCVYVGLKATINGDKYVFSGDSISGYEWVYNPSRLPQGYTEVEYITSENISTSVSGPYIDTNFTPNQNTRVVMDYQPMINGQEHRRIFGSGEFNTLGYVYNMEGSVGQSNCYYYYKFGNTSSWYTTTIHPDLNRHTVDFNNNGQILLDNTSIATLPNNTFTCTYHLGLFRSIFNQYTTNNICLLGRVYSCQVYDNGTLVRDFVPCINPSNAVGMYDIVNDVFYTTANASYQFTAGNPV